MTAILVAGGAGYVGAHVARALAGAGFLPVTLDDLSAGFRAFVKWGPLIEAGVDDRAAIDAAIVEHRIQACVLLAGSIEVGRSVREPLAFWRNNVAAPLVLLERLAAARIGAVVFSSTAAVYGAPDIVPIPETHALRPANPYGETKLAVERVLAALRDAGGPAWVALRYFNAAGAAVADGIGEAHEPETHLIPLACLAALGAKPPLSVMGDDYDTPDGTAIRDYVHVEDLADAHVEAVRAGLAGRSGAFNLGTGTGHSVREVLRAVEAASGRQAPHSIGPRRPGDVARLVADPRRAAKELGWRAKRDLAAIVDSAWRWHAQRTGAKT
ncbi:MAG: UDP-glucose 4-epimerase GalE [Tagaea sp.]